MKAALEDLDWGGVRVLSGAGELQPYLCCFS